MTQATSGINDLRSNVDRRRKTAAALLEKWMLEDDGYDDRVWPILEGDLKDGAVQCRETDELGA